MKARMYGDENFPWSQYDGPEFIERSVAMADAVVMAHRSQNDGEN